MNLQHCYLFSSYCFKLNVHRATLAMLDPITIVSLVATIGTLIDYGNKLVSRIIEYQDSVETCPQPFRGLRVNIPLILKTLELISDDAQNGKVDDETYGELEEVIANCRSEIMILNKIVDKIKPSSEDSFMQRGYKAAQSIRQEKEIYKHDRQLEKNLAVLGLYTAAQSSRSQAIRGTAKGVFSVPFERDPNYVERPEVMQQIGQILQTQNRVVLAGMGGVG